MQRRVDEPDHDRQPVHGAEDALEVALLELLELGHGRIERVDRALLVGVECLAAVALGLGSGRGVGDQDGAAHDLQPRALPEHVLGPAEADSQRAIRAGLRGLLRLVGVGPHLHAGRLVRPAEQLLKVDLVLETSADGRQLAEEELARRTVEAQPVAFLEADLAVGGIGGLRAVVNHQLGAAGHAGLADLARNDGGMGRGAATGGDDALGHCHAMEVVR